MPYQGEPPSLVLPLVYDVSTNITQLAEKRDPGPGSATAAASMQLKRFAEYASLSECSLFPAIRDLLTNLTLPSEPSVISQVISCQKIIFMFTERVLSRYKDFDFLFSYKNNILNRYYLTCSI